MARTVRNVKDVLESVRELRREWEEEAESISDHWEDEADNANKREALFRAAKYANLGKDLAVIENDLEYLAR